MKRSRLPAILTVLVLVFLNSPLVVLVLNSFNASRFGGSWEGFTWQWYERLWQAEAVWDAFFLSLCLAFASTLAATLLGTLAAWSLHRHRSHLQNLHRCLLVLPLALPELLMGMALLSLFTALHIPTGPLTIWAAHITFSISYVAMVVLGYEDTLQVTVDDMAHHTAAVARAKPASLIVADMPWLSYHVSIEDTVRNAAALIRAGAQCVKLEGGRKRIPMIEALIDAEIPVMGHIGLTPQSVNAMGGFKVQGRQHEAALALVDDAKAVGLDLEGFFAGFQGDGALGVEGGAAVLNEGWATEDGCWVYAHGLLGIEDWGLGISR
jgi:ABC-type phosphate/phosphonate transport system permease subunit